MLQQNAQAMQCLVQDQRAVELGFQDCKKEET